MFTLINDIGVGAVLSNALLLSPIAIVAIYILMFVINWCCERRGYRRGKK